MPQRPESVAEWMRIARGDLALARSSPGPEVPLEMLCFHARQAAEKAIKAVLVCCGIPPPKTHNIERLIRLLPATIHRTPDFLASAALSDYASLTRYPGLKEPVLESDYREALRLAGAVVEWAAGIVG